MAHPLFYMSLTVPPMAQPADSGREWVVGGAAGSASDLVAVYGVDLDRIGYIQWFENDVDYTSCCWLMGPLQ